MNLPNMTKKWEDISESVNTTTEISSAPTENERTVTGMDDYIKREALRNALYDADAITMNGVKILNQFPSSDVAPVKHGQWIGSGDGYANGELVYDMWECSECGFNDGFVAYNFCPNCGARMDGEEP